MKSGGRANYLQLSGAQVVLKLFKTFAVIHLLLEVLHCGWEDALY